MKYLFAKMFHKVELSLKIQARSTNVEEERGLSYKIPFSKIQGENENLKNPEIHFVKMLSHENAWLLNLEQFLFELNKCRKKHLVMKGYTHYMQEIVPQ